MLFLLLNTLAMAELENDNQDLENQIDDLEEETQYFSEVDEEWLTVDDYNKLKRDHEKATKKLVELKKQLKAQTKTPVDDVDALIEKKMGIKDFYKENPDAKEFQELIEKEMKDNPNWSIAKAYKSVMLDNQDLLNNRAVYWESLISWKQGWENFSVVNSNTYLNMNFSQRKEYEQKSQQKYWEVRFK